MSYHLIHSSNLKELYLLFTENEAALSAKTKKSMLQHDHSNTIRNPNFRQHTSLHDGSKDANVW